MVNIFLCLLHAGPNSQGSDKQRSCAALGPGHAHVYIKIYIRRPLLWRRQGRRLGPPKVWNLSSPNPYFSGPESKSAKSSHLLDCGLWALCQTVGHTGRWSSQLLDSGRFRRSKTSHLPDCGLWALRDCGRSCAGCGLGALARQILFF